MVRKQNKSVKATKKDSSVGINAKKGGKVQKKLPDSKAKKKVESQVKQSVKSKGKPNKSQAKLISPVNTGRRSSRTNSDNTKKSSTPASQHSNIDKVSTSTKAATSSRTEKVQPAKKRKSNPQEQPEDRKYETNTKSHKSNKNETSFADQKKVGNKMSLRGKKRSYAQLASGNQTEGNNESKKRKTVYSKYENSRGNKNIKTEGNKVSKKRKTEDSKDVTSRGNRSIKPTVKGSEWRKTILQKKPTSAKQEKPSKMAQKTSLKNKSSAATKKSTAQNKKTLPPLLTGTNKTVNKTVTKLSKRQSGGKILTEKIQKLSPSKSKVKNTKKVNSVLNKSPKARSTSKKSSAKPGESEKNSSKANTLATSIKNKFNSCVSNKRKSKDTELQENVLVAQGILHDILNSVGPPDILPTDKEFEKLATSDSLILPVEVLDQDKVCISKQVIDVPSQTITSAVSETILNHMLVEGEKSVAVSDNVVNESALELNYTKINESNSDSNKNVDLENEKSIDVDKEILSSNKDINNQNQINENDTLEEMELHLSDTSATSVNDNDLVSSEKKSTVSSDIEKINRTGLCSKKDDLVDSVLDSGIKLNEKLMKQVNKLPEPLQSEKTSHVNGNDSLSDSTETNSLCNEIKVSPQMDTKKENFSQQDTEKRELSIKKNVSVSLPEISPDISELVIENSSCLITSLSTHKNSVEENDTGTKNTTEFSKEGVGNAISYQQENPKESVVLNDIVHNSKKEIDVITDKKEEGIEPSIKINQCVKESSGSKINLKSTNNAFEEHAKKKEIPLTNLNGETVKVENFIANERTSDNESSFVEHQDTFNNGKNTTSDLKEIMTSVKDDSCIINNHSSSLDKPQNGQICKTNIKKSESVNDKVMTDTGESIPSDTSSQKNDGSTPDSAFNTQELTSPGNKSLSGISQDNKEVNDFIVGKVDTNLLDSNVCLLQSDLVELKENSTLHTIANSKSEIASEKHCLEVGTGETGSQIETSQNLGNSKTDELKSKELNVDKPVMSEKLPLHSDILSNNVEESIKVPCDAQKVNSDHIRVPDKVESLNSVNDNSSLQELGFEKRALIPEMTSNHHIDSSDCTELMCEEISLDVGNSKEKFADGPELEHIATEVFREIPLNVSSATKEEDSPAGQPDISEELNLKPGSSTDLTEDINIVTLENKSSSSHIEQISEDETPSPEDSKTNKKTDSSNNLTDDVSQVSLGSSSISSQAEQISVGEHFSSKSSCNDTNLSLQTPLKNSESSYPSGEIVSSNAEMLADSSENKVTSEEFLVMEEGNQEETTQDSIVVDDTDGESMQYSSDTHSNRMSVDEENPGMEVDTEEVAAAVSTCSNIEMNMEVS